MKSKLFLSTMITMFVITSSYGQFSRQQAIDLVQGNIITDVIENVDAYCAYNSNSNDIEMIDNMFINNPYSESWVFFVNDNPFADWYHQSRFIFVNTSNGAYTIESVTIYPKSWETDYEKISLAVRPNPVDIDGTSFVADPQKEESNYNYALIVVAIDEYRNWYNTSLIYNVLLQNYYYQKENIFVLYNYDGHSYLPNVNGDDLDDPSDPSDDIDGPATMNNIQATIANLTASLEHGDQLAVFFTGVPVQDIGGVPNMAFHVDQNNIVNYPVTSISEPMEDINCGQMILNFDVNSASDVSWYFEAANGTNVLCQNRYLTGSVSSGEPNYAEMYFSGGNFSEQLFYWASAARGYLPEIYSPWLYNPTAIGTENGGGFPYSMIIPNHPGDNILDDDGDNFIQMEEAFNYADDMNTYTNNYFFQPFMQEIPPVNPIIVDEFPFTDDVLSLSGICGKLWTGQTVKGNFIISPLLELAENVAFSFDSNSNIFLYGGFTNDFESSSLSFSSGSVIDPKDHFGYIYINQGEFFLGEYSELNPNAEGTIYLIINNNQNTIFDHITANFAYFGLYGQEFQLLNSSLSKCYIKTFNIPSIVLLNCEFIWSETYFDGIFIEPGINSTANIQGSNFSGKYEDSNIAVKVRNYKDLYVSNNTFDHTETSLELWDCGYSYLPAKINNNVFDRGGVIIYNTIANFSINTFSYNEIGFKILNESSVGITGDQNACEPEETQYFNLNNQLGIYMSHSNFNNFRYNAFECSPPGEKGFIKITGQYPQEYWDVRYNYWGENFNPQLQLAPYISYNYVPMWTPCNYDYEQDEASILFDNSNTLLVAENYSEAEVGFKELITLYPFSKYSQSSLKKLFVIEQLRGSDYQDLKTYLLSDSTIQGNTTLTQIAEKIANQCDIASNNWTSAITWLEEKIVNPTSFDDSIFSIIDLEKTYLLMENSGNKSSKHYGKLAQYIPKSIEDYNIYSDELIKLLPHDNLNSNSNFITTKLNNGKLSQNIPNPFSGNTQIWYMGQYLNK